MPGIPDRERACHDSGRGNALGALTISPNGSRSRCEHLDGLVPVTPRSDHCLACQVSGTRWKALLVCLNCGWVACSDDSPGQHAKAHYQETDHPLAVGLDPGSRRRWCYIHQRVV